LLFQTRGQYFRRLSLVLASVIAVIVCTFIVSPFIDRAKQDSPIQLLQLGEDQRNDLRKALALEVSKNRYEIAKSRLKALHDELIQVFDELKQEAVKKESARDDLVHLLAEVNPYKLQAISRLQSQPFGSTGLMQNQNYVARADSKQSRNLRHDIDKLFQKVSFGKQLQQQFSRAQKFGSAKSSGDDQQISGVQRTSRWDLANMVEEESRKEMEEVIHNHADER